MSLLTFTEFNRDVNLILMTVSPIKHILNLKSITGGRDGLIPRKPDIFTYIDDANAVEKVRISGSVVNISQNKQIARVHAEKSQEIFNTVTLRANNICMRVNEKKTQLLCISSNLTSTVTSYIRHGNEKIESTDSLKIIGFMFSNKPNVGLHVDYMIKKAKRKLWTLRHLKQAGLGCDGLLKIFNYVIRPTLEYACPTFHPMLSTGMRDKIEYTQKRASKLIFGWNSNYDELVNAGKIETIESRRKRSTLNFARKAEKSERFKHWFREKNTKALH